MHFLHVLTLLYYQGFTWHYHYDLAKENVGTQTYWGSDFMPSPSFATELFPSFTSQLFPSCTVDYSQVVPLNSS